jgi:hypothetical protein
MDRELEATSTMVAIRRRFGAHPDRVVNVRQLVPRTCDDFRRHSGAVFNVDEDRWPVVVHAVLFFSHERCRHDDQRHGCGRGRSRHVRLPSVRGGGSGGRKTASITIREISEVEA